ncbi:MAG TPA: endoribonuclease MazF [Candidatus Methylomirabilis sp.]|nr:endoribonuclease MazF [Candidatus Methylomirabilis sp.]HSB77767.1 endoribonuclease MazF [Candidatus Methylomirabilis sp.]
MPAVHAPDRGDIVWVDFDPQAGHEQAGRRPALIVSPQSYNQKVGLVLLCPITNRRKGYPFEVPLPKGLRVAGVVLADQVKSMDWRARRAEFCCKAPAVTVLDVIGKAQTLLAV